MKQLIGLTEGDLHQIVENSIKKVIRENDVNQRGYISKGFKNRTESPEAMHMPWGYFDNEMPYKNSEVTEGDLHRIINKSITSTLNENFLRESIDFSNTDILENYLYEIQQMIQQDDKIGALSRIDDIIDWCHTRGAWNA